MTQVFIKDPDAVLDYAWDWSGWLESGESILSHTVSAPSGITVESSSENAGVVTAWMSGGTVETCIIVSCRIVTNMGRTDERSMKIYIQER